MSALCLFPQYKQPLRSTIAFTWLPRSWFQAVLHSQIRCSEGFCNRKFRLHWSQDYSEHLSYNLWLESRLSSGRLHTLTPASVWEISIAEARKNVWKVSEKKVSSEKTFLKRGLAEWWLCFAFCSVWCFIWLSGELWFCFHGRLCLHNASEHRTAGEGCVCNVAVSVHVPGSSVSFPQQR